MARSHHVSKVELRKTTKYGSDQLGLYAVEDIDKDELIFACDSTKCGAYLNYCEHPEGMSRIEVIAYISEHPDRKEFVTNYYCLCSDDYFNFDRKFRGMSLCYYPNHSCDSNSYFNGDEHFSMFAKKDIKVGEEITVDYQTFDTECGFRNGMVCKCNTSKCRGVLKFDHYRDIDWANENYKYCTPYLQKRIDELKSKWYSSSCFVAFYENKTKEGLTALRKITGNELVAVYSDSTKINQESHFLRHNDKPNCYVNKDGHVYAYHDITQNTELTLNFNAI